MPILSNTRSSIMVVKVDIPPAAIASKLSVIIDEWEKPVPGGYLPGREEGLRVLGDESTKWWYEREYFYAVVVETGLSCTRCKVGDWVASWGVNSDQGHWKDTWGLHSDELVKGNDLFQLMDEDCWLITLGRVNLTPQELRN